MRLAATRANRRAGEVGLRKAREMSSGVFSTALLSAPFPGLNHPYATSPFNSRGAHGAIPYGTAAWINKQSGDFYSSWRLRVMPTSTPTLLLTNDAAHAKWLEFGTKNSIPRQMREALEKEISIAGSQFMAEEIAAIWRVRFDTK